jgi:SAM-dependent methyltransferase
MDASRKHADEQAALWNGIAGQSWVEAQELLDGILKPFEDLLLETVATKPRATLLDVGCGTGSTTLAIKRQLGANAQCVGVDISEPMLELARSRAERAGAAVRFIRADAELHPFEHASFDMVVSRFGVMFFDDPVRAFANLRRAARPGAELCVLVWRGPSENPFMTAAERAAAPILPNIPARDPDAPGQFAFADPTRVSRILDQSGWTDIDLRPVDVECTFPEKDLVRYVTRLGPLGRVLQDADDQTTARVLAAVRPAFAPFVEGPTVRFNAACWKVGARAPASTRG